MIRSIDMRRSVCIAAFLLLLTVALRFESAAAADSAVRNNRASNLNAVLTPLEAQISDSTRPASLVQEAWQKGKYQADQAITAARESLVDSIIVEVGKSAGATKVPLQTRIIQQVNSNYTQVVRRALIFALQASKNQNLNSALVAEQSAGWAFNLKAVGRDLSSYVARRMAINRRFTNLEMSVFRSELEKRLTPVSLVEMEQKLEALTQPNSSSVLVEYITLPASVSDQGPAKNNYVAWLLMSSGGSAKAVLADLTGTTADINFVSKDIVEKMQAVIGDPDDVMPIATYQSQMQKLRRDLIDSLGAEAEAALRQSDSWWLISPVEDAWLVSFASMPMDDKNLDDYAIEHHRISYLIAARDITALNTSRVGKPFGTRKENAIIYYDPDYSGLEHSTKMLFGTSAIRTADSAESPASGAAHWTHKLSFVKAVNERQSEQELACFRCRRRSTDENSYLSAQRPQPVAVERGRLLNREIVRPALWPNIDARSFTAGGDTIPLRSIYGAREFGDSLNLILSWTPRFGALATEAAFRKDSGTTISGSPPQAICFVTHGFFPYPPPDVNDPGSSPASLNLRKLLTDDFKDDQLSRCGLALANANITLGAPIRLIKPSDLDGLLLGREIADTAHLDHTPLVLLLCCDGGAGQKFGEAPLSAPITNADAGVSGEGLVSLRHAFMLAGAKSVVASAWPLAFVQQAYKKPSDARTAYDIHTPTYDFLIDFAKQLSNTDIEDALRQSQLRIIQIDKANAQSRTKPIHPFYWASLSLTGQW